MASKGALVRLQKEYRALLKVRAPPRHAHGAGLSAGTCPAPELCDPRLPLPFQEPVPCLSAHPSPNNILEWHFVVEGSEGTPYEGGVYHGKVRCSASAPIRGSAQTPGSDPIPDPVPRRSPSPRSTPTSRRPLSCSLPRAGARRRQAPSRGVGPRRGRGRGRGLTPRFVPQRPHAAWTPTPPRLILPNCAGLPFRPSCACR